MKKVFVLIFIVSFLFLPSVDAERIPYTLYLKSTVGDDMASVGYVYTNSAGTRGIDNKNKKLPSLNDSDFPNYEWYFIPVGADQPGLYYLQNGNGQYLGVASSSSLGAFDEIGEDGFKFFIGNINFPNIRRIQNNTVRIFVKYKNKSYVAYSSSGSSKVAISNSVSFSTSAFLIAPSPSKQEQYVYNGDMELIANYKTIITSVILGIPPVSSDSDFSAPATGASDYFPYDFARSSCLETGNRSRLIYRKEETGEELSEGYYFIRMQSGDTLKKTIDNPDIERKSTLKLSLKVRATQAESPVGTVVLKDSQRTVLAEELTVAKANTSEMDYYDSSAWNVCEFEVLVDSFSSLATVEITSSMEEGELLDVDNVYFSYVTEPNPAVFWSPSEGEFENDWNYAGNWIFENGDPGFVPDKYTAVVLRSGQPTYPVLTEDQSAACSHIYFETGSQLGNQFFLDYDFASIQMELNTMQWYALTAPLHNMYSGDYSFEQANPITEMRLFKTENPQTGLFYSDWTTSFSTVTHPLSTGMPYSLRIGRVYYATINEDGADVDSKEIIETAVFEFPKLNESFVFYDQTTKLPTGRVDPIPDNGRAFANRFIYEDVKSTASIVPLGDELLFIPTGALSAEEITMVGNPLMAGLDFPSFYLKNRSLIYPEFKLLVNGNEYVTYSGLDVDEDGIIESVVVAEDVLSSGVIPPMSSFAVRTRNGYEGDRFLIAKSMNRLYEPSGEIRKAEPETVVVELHQGGGISKCLILFSDSYTNSYLPSEDSRKLAIKGGGAKPMIYSVVDDQCLEINRMKSLLVELPLGIVSAQKGNSDIYIKGLSVIPQKDDFYLKDKLTGDEIPFSDKEILQYSFQNDPENSEARFCIMRKPPVSNPSVHPGDIFVYTSGELLNIHSSSGDIDSLAVYTVDGKLVYCSKNLSTKAVVALPSTNTKMFIIKVQTTYSNKTIKVIF